MAKQFICISCWKEFSREQNSSELDPEEVICPFCGYSQRAPSDQSAPIEPEEEPPLPEPDSSGVENLTWETMGQDASERTDEVTASDGVDDDVDFSSELADEKTPVVDSSALLDEGEGFSLVATGSTTPAEWLLKTPSGLVFKFTDPEALLGWKKKLATYHSLEVSIDGSLWKDFAHFVSAFERIGDPVRAFNEGEITGPIPNVPIQESSAPMSMTDTQERKPPEAPFSDTRPGDPSTEKTANPVSATTQFTFKVQEDKGAGLGVYILFAVLGLAIGAGVVALVLLFK